MAPEYESHGTYGCSVSRYLTESAIVRQAVLKLAARSKAFNRRERQDSAKFAKKFSASFAQSLRSLRLSAFCLRELSRCKLGDEINNRRDFTNSKRDAAGAWGMETKKGEVLRSPFSVSVSVLRSESLYYSAIYRVYLKLLMYIYRVGPVVAVPPQLDLFVPHALNKNGAEALGTDWV